MAATENEKPVAVAPKAALTAGGQVAAIIPNSFESCFRMAQVIHAAKMAPASLDSVEKITIAIMHGLEVGLTPMAAIQSIAVINGQPTIFGDGMLALVRASGLLEEIIEDVEVDDEGQPTIATCRIKRRGESQWAVSSFTRVEAIRAGLWGKRGPWEGYKARMLKMRARSWALRDKFADILKGLHSAEEVMDITPSGSASTAPPEPRRYRAVVEDIPAATASPDIGADSSGPAAAAAEAATPPPVSELSKLWTVADDVIGQDAGIMALTEFIEMAETEADLDNIESRNAERLKRITGTRRAALNQMLRDKRQQVSGGR
jgi:hypothetical protein